MAKTPPCIRWYNTHIAPLAGADARLVEIVARMYTLPHSERRAVAREMDAANAGFGTALLAYVETDHG